VPLYEYKCVKCGKKTEKIETVAGPHLKKCPHCGGKVEQSITAPSIQFKGSGWYVTDYAGKSPAKDGAGAEKSEGEKSEKGEKGEKKDAGAKEGAAKETKDSKDSGEKKPVKKK
jgi:putative FmdB family regulatory protein